MDLLIMAIGAIIIFLIVFDIFETLLDPEDQGRITNAVCWIVWRIVRQLPLKIMTYSGPLAYVAVLLTWAGMLVTGWAFIYWPHLPDLFAFDDGLGPEHQTGFLTAFYVSMVTLGTLGYGDITPTEGWLRILGPMQAFIGFFLLSAAITWILAIYQDIEIRRSLAHETLLLRETVEHLDISFSDLRPDTVERLIEEMTQRIVMINGSLSQFPITYFFRISDDDQSLAVMSLFLLDLTDELRRERLPLEVRLNASMLSRALDHLAATLEKRFINLGEGTTTRDILTAYAIDHRRNIIENERD